MADGLAPGPLWHGTLIQALYIIRISNWLAFAATILLLYDILITIESEVTLVWRRKWSFSSVIYLVNRYGVLVQAGLSNIPNIAQFLSDDACQGWNLFTNWSIPIILMMIEATLVLRVSALYMHARSVTIPLWFLYVSCAAAMCLFSGFGLRGTFPLEKLAPEVVGCLLGGTETLFWAIWLPSLILETTLFAMTMTRIWYHLKKGVETRILGLMARDGFMYFLVIFAMMLLNVILSLTTSMVYYSLLIEPTLVLSSILCSRLYLNLRSVGQASEEIETQATPVPPVEIYIHDSWAEDTVRSCCTSVSGESV